MDEAVTRFARMFVAVGKGFDRLGEWFVGLASLLLLAMGLLINVEVFGRYFFSFSTLISDEYSGYLFSWMTLICFFYALRTEHLLRVDALVSGLRGRMRDLMGVLAALIGLAVSLILTQATFTMWHTNWMFNSVSLQPSQTPLYIPQLIMPLGFGLLALGYLERLVAAILRLTGQLPQHGERPQ